MSSSATYERLVVPYVHCGSPSAPRATDATRSVVAALEAAGLRRVALAALDDHAPEALACVSVDAKLRSLRAIGNAALDLAHGTKDDLAALRARCDDHGNDRRALRLFVDALLDFLATTPRKKTNALLVYAFSTHDDALDLLCLQRRLPANHPPKKAAHDKARKGRKR